MAWHTPVLRDEMLFFLKPKKGAAIIDATVGDGGHSEAILRLTAGQCRITAIDCDPVMIQRAAARLKRFEASVVFKLGNYADVLEQISESPDGILFDFGAASFHFDEASRGFSFSRDEQLDMRFSPTGCATAADIVNRWPQDKIAAILREYGEERFFARIARAIVAHRDPYINTTGQLVSIINSAIPRPYRYGRLHPATRTFQALRMAVNDEPENIRRGLKAGFNRLKAGGRLLAISFHSREDALVKEAFRGVVHAGLGTILTKRPVRPTVVEQAANIRSRSARLRAIEKFHET